MIKANKLFYSLRIYDDKVCFLDYLRLCLLTDYRSKKPFGFISEKKATSFIDLTLSLDEILNNMHSGTRRDIRRAEREGINFEICRDIDEFVKFYNEFAIQKSISTINRSSICKYKYYLLTKCVFNGQTCAMHATVLDSHLKIARLLFSCSLRLSDSCSISAQLVGYANKLLHYKDFMFLKESAFEKYDFAGICTDESDKVRFSIGKFKMGFGGNLIPTFNYTSPLFYVVNKIKSIM